MTPIDRAEPQKVATRAEEARRALGQDSSAPIELYKAIILTGPPYDSTICEEGPYGASLIRVQSAPMERLAHSLCGRLLTHHGLETIQLAVLAGENGGHAYAVHEWLGGTPPANGQHRVVPISSLEPHEVTEVASRQLAALSRGEGTGRYGKPGWLASLRKRIGATTITNVDHWNRGIDFSLLAFTENGKRYWFKGVGHPNLHEYGLTMLLSELFPIHLPRVAHRLPEWHGWVTEHLDGVPLFCLSDPQEWMRALAALARIQRRTVHHCDDLLTAGAMDCSASSLLTQLDDFFRDMSYAMAAQTSRRSKPLSRAQLDSLSIACGAICRYIAHCNLPNTILHGDLGHGNVIATTHGVVFLDWAETYVGCPFLSAQYLIESYRETHNRSAAASALLRESYASHWAGYLDSSTQDKIFSLLPAYAALAFAVMTWQRNRMAANGQACWPLLRSLVRRIDSELDQIGSSLL